MDLRNPGQTGKFQSSFRWCWNSYIACVYSGHAWENPHQETGLIHRGAVHSKGGTSSTIKAHPIWKIYVGFTVHKSSSSPALVLGQAEAIGI